MLTYQLQDRIFRLKEDVRPTFPNNAKIRLKLGPPEAFGMSDGLSRTAVQGSELKLLYDANTGRSRVQSKPTLKPLEIIFTTPNQRFELRGDSLILEAHYESFDAFQKTLMSLYYALPPLLNIEFRDPPFIINATGSIGSTSFTWEHKEAISTFQTTNSELLEKHVANAIDRLTLISNPANRRLVAGLHYFHVASRLIVAGNSDWEFMAEIVLNMCKCLEILFGKSMDAVRVQLKTLGYMHEEIEGDFIPLMILRNHFDVGHPRLVILDQKQLTIVYRYLSRSEDCLRRLFRTLVDKLQVGEYSLPEHGNLALDNEDQKRLNKLVESMAVRVNL